MNMVSMATPGIIPPVVYTGYMQVVPSMPMPAPVSMSMTLPAPAALMPPAGPAGVNGDEQGGANELGQVRRMPGKRRVGANATTSAFRGRKVESRNSGQNVDDLGPSMKSMALK